MAVRSVILSSFICRRVHSHHNPLSTTQPGAGSGSIVDLCTPTSKAPVGFTQPEYRFGMCTVPRLPALARALKCTSPLSRSFLQCAIEALTGQPSSSHSLRSLLNRLSKPVKGAGKRLAFSGGCQKSNKPTANAGGHPRSAAHCGAADRDPTPIDDDEVTHRLSLRMCACCFSLFKLPSVATVLIRLATPAPLRRRRP
jgi:hypothetical protein